MVQVHGMPVSRGRWKTKPPMNWKAKGRTSNNGDKLEVFVMTY